MLVFFNSSSHICNRYEALRAELASGSIGEVVQVICSFGEKIEAARLSKKELGGGTVLDLGIYTIQLAQLVFGGEEPVVVGAGHQGEDGCDQSTSTTLLYSGGRTATLITHSRVQVLLPPPPSWT